MARAIYAGPIRSQLEETSQLLVRPPRLTRWLRDGVLFWAIYEAMRNSRSSAFNDWASEQGATKALRNSC